MLYIYSPRIYLFIVPYTCKWMDCMKQCFGGLCFAFLFSPTNVWSIICLLCCVNFTVTNIRILFVIAAWNYVISHECRCTVLAGGDANCLAHLQVKYCTRVRLYFTFIHVYLNLFLHVHKKTVLFVCTTLLSPTIFITTEWEHRLCSLVYVRFFFLAFWIRTIYYDFLLLRRIILPLFFDIRLFHLYLPVFRGKLLETLYRYSVDHYVITRASVCVIARVFLLTSKLYFFLHVHGSESRGTMILPACAMPLCLSCLLFTCHYFIILAVSYTEIYF